MVKMASCRHKMNKQNVFDDFIAAANFLTENNYTSQPYLALRGGSNGGFVSCNDPAP